MRILPLPAFEDNYIWLLLNDLQRTMACVDPGDAKPVIEYAKAENITLTAILLTHHHADHIGGVPALLDAFPKVHVYGPEDPRIPHVDTALHHGDQVAFHPYVFHVLGIPGHTSTHIAYYEPTEGILFSGDTLFSIGCGRVFDGTITELYHTLLRLRQLPDQTKLYCGHEYTRANLAFAITIEPKNEAIQTYFKTLTSHPTACSLPSILAHEKMMNPFLRTDLLALRPFALSEGLDPADPFAIFKALRSKKDDFRI